MVVVDDPENKLPLPNNKLAIDKSGLADDDEDVVVVVGKCEPGEALRTTAVEQEEQPIFFIFKS